MIKLKNILNNMKDDAKNYAENFKKYGLIQTIILDHEVSRKRGYSIGIKHPIDIFIQGSKKILK